MMLWAPTFKDTSGWFPEKNIETTFFALNEGLKNVEKKIGAEQFQALMELSNRMRAYFEADPDDQTDDTIKGRECILEMEKILRASNSHRKPRGGSGA
ncbi:MAG: hypothetical protein E6Q28_13405 [Afipia sp.]|nr:MAG: hypothetical protein E6Q28_13405 [Afipia sp.]